MSSMLQMYHANLAARLHPTQIGNSGNPFPIGQSPSLSAIGQFWQPHGPSAHALSNLHRSAPSAMASLLGSVQHKIQHEPVRTGSTGIGSTLTQPSPFSGPVLIGTGARNEDSCGGSSHSNSSDTNGSDTNSGDEVIVHFWPEKNFSAQNIFRQFWTFLTLLVNHHTLDSPLTLPRSFRSDRDRCIVILSDSIGQKVGLDPF